MAQHHLTEKEVQELLLQYEGEKRKLSYQLSKVNEVISNLQNSLAHGKDVKMVVAKTPENPKMPMPGAEFSAPLSVQEKMKQLASATKEDGTNDGMGRKIERRGRPRKGEEKSKPADAATPASPVKKFQKSVISPETLENMLVNIVRKEGRPVSSGEMLQMTLRAVEGTSLAAKDISHNISGTLYSLHTKGILIAVQNSAKTQVHALPEWLDADGKLLSQHGGDGK